MLRLGSGETEDDDGAAVAEVLPPELLPAGAATDGDVAAVEVAELLVAAELDSDPPAAGNATMAICTVADPGVFSCAAEFVGTIPKQTAVATGMAIHILFVIWPLTFQN